MTGNILNAYELFQKHEKLTDVQLERLLGINPNSVRPIRLKLEAMGLIRRLKAKKNHIRGRRSSQHTRMHTLYKLVKNPVKVVSLSPVEIRVDNLLKKVSQLEKMLLVLKKQLSRG